MQLNSRIIILVQAPGSSVTYVTVFKKQYFCAMLCVYAFKRLVGENEIDYHLSVQNKIENIVFLNI